MISGHSGFTACAAGIEEGSGASPAAGRGALALLRRRAIAPVQHL